MSYGDSEASTYDGPSEGPMRDPDDRELARAANAKLSRRESPGGRAPIEAALDRCDEVASRVMEHAESLHHRLSPILGPDRPEPALGEVRSSEDSSALANRLDQLAERLDEAVRSLVRTSRRIEL